MPLNIPFGVKDDLVVSGNMSEGPLRYGPMRNYHLILMSSGEDSQEANLRNLDGDKNLLDIMLIEYQIHKENGDHVHEDIEVDTAIANGGVVNYDHAL